MSVTDSHNGLRSVIVYNISSNFGNCINLGVIISFNLRGSTTNLRLPSFFANKNAGAFQNGVSHFSMMLDRSICNICRVASALSASFSRNCRLNTYRFVLRSICIGSLLHCLISFKERAKYVYSHTIAAISSCASHRTV